MEHVSINLYEFLIFLEIGPESICIIVSLGALGFDEFASQVYRVGCTQHISIGFVGGACSN